MRYFFGCHSVAALKPRWMDVIPALGCRAVVSRQPFLTDAVLRYAAAPMGQPSKPAGWMSSQRRIVGLSYHGSRDEEGFVISRQPQNIRFSRHSHCFVPKKPYLCTKLIDNAIQSTTTEIATCHMARL